VQGLAKRKLGRSVAPPDAGHAFRATGWCEEIRHAEPELERSDNSRNPTIKPTDTKTDDT